MLIVNALPQVAIGDVTLDMNEYQIAHDRASFLSGAKVQQLLETGGWLFYIVGNPSRIERETLLYGPSRKTDYRSFKNMYAMSRIPHEISCWEGYVQSLNAL